MLYNISHRKKMCSLGLADKVYTKCLGSSELLKPVHRTCGDLWLRDQRIRAQIPVGKTGVFQSRLTPDKLCDWLLTVSVPHFSYCKMRNISNNYLKKL